jgi:hypothetical protein
LLVLVRAWLAAGRPPGKRVLGSFESWASVVGGILEHAGVPGFLHDTEALYEAADAEGQEWREFVTAWWDKHRDHWVTASDLLNLALERDLLGATIGDRTQRSQKIRLGKALSSARDRHFASWRVLAGRNTDGNAAKYRLVVIEGAQAQEIRYAPGDQMNLADRDPGCSSAPWMSKEHIQGDIQGGKRSDDDGL